MPTALQLAAGDPQLVARVKLCRQLLNRRALAAAAASAVPVPGLHWMVDAALLTRLLPEINAQFGLTPEQLARLPAHQRDQVQRSVTAVGSFVIGRVVTRDLVLRLAKAAGVRLTARQAARFVPVAGQAVAAALGYTALRWLGERHLRDCVTVVREARLALPPPQPGALAGPDAG